MHAKKLIQKISDFLNLKSFTMSGKKKALKELLKRLKERRVLILKELKSDCTKERETELHQELELLSLHISKAKKKIDLL